MAFYLVQGYSCKIARETRFSRVMDGVTVLTILRIYLSLLIYLQVDIAPSMGIDE